MNLVGYQVSHKAFGDGVVTKWDNKYVTVRFSSTEKTFVYPNAFNGYMTILDPSAMESVNEDIAVAVAAKNALEQSKAQERERQMRSGIVIPGSKAAAERHENFGTEDASEEI